MLDMHRLGVTFPWMFFPVKLGRFAGWYVQAFVVVSFQPFCYLNTGIHRARFTELRSCQKVKVPVLGSSVYNLCDFIFVL